MSRDLGENRFRGIGYGGNVFDQQTSWRAIIVSDDFVPPRTLNSVALEVWNRHAKCIWSEGRWAAIDHDQLALYAETFSLYRAFFTDIENDGTVIKGRDGGTVKHPSLSGLHTTRADLMRLARAIPLVAAKPDLAGAEVDKFITDVMADL